MIRIDHPAGMVSIDYVKYDGTIRLIRYHRSCWQDALRCIDSDWSYQLVEPETAADAMHAVSRIEVELRKRKPSLLQKLMDVFCEV